MARYASQERKLKEEARHRSEIVEAALGVLGKKCLHAITMSDVARAAGFSLGKIYLHFPSKQALYEEILDHYASRLVALTEQALAHPGSAREKIETLVRDSLAFLDDNALFLGLFVKEMLAFELRTSTEFGASFAEKCDHQIRCIQQVFEQGLVAGEFCRFDAEALTLKFIGILNTVVTHHARNDSERPFRELGPLIIRLFSESPLA